MNVSITVSNPGGTTPNFTASMTDLQAFINDVRYDIKKNASYPLVYDETAEAWTLYGVIHPMVGITLTITDDTEDMLADGDTVTVAITLDEVQVTDPQRRTADMYDYSTDGKIARGIPARMVFVEEEADLDDLPTDYMQGTIAATIGFGNMWQLNGDGEWVAIGAAEGEGT